jgi:plasmid stabilization system protein ParE
MARTIRILSRADGDADDIFVWLAKRSPAGAKAWNAALRERLDSLASTDWNGSPAPEAQEVGLDLRQAFFKTRRGRTYRVLFVSTAEEVTVLRIRGPGQRPVGRPDVAEGEL